MDKRTNIVSLAELRLIAANRQLSELRQRRELAQMALEDALERVASYQAMEEAMVNEIKQMEGELNDE
jgi:hypothetical protein